MFINCLRGLHQFRSWVLLLIIVLLATDLSPRAVYSQTVICAEEIVMQRGQTLATIAARAFGTQDAVAEIIAATNAKAAVDESFATISDPDLVEVGWKICVPAITTRETATSAAEVGATARVARTVTPRSVMPHAAISQGAIAARLTGSKGNAENTRAASANALLEQNENLMSSLLAERMGENDIHPLSIEYLRGQAYPGSPLTLEATLPGGSNYSQHLVSYQSEGLALYAAMTLPQGEKPEHGWPVVIFIHGYIEPSIYSPVERYTEFIDALAGNGYIVLRPDLRGHGDSEGQAVGAYGDPGYTIDLLNALASIQQYPEADPNRISLFGHSMGGYLAARAMVVSDAIRAGVIWSGVVAPYEELVAAWEQPTSTIAVGELPIDRVLLDTLGTPQENPALWASLSANSYAADLSGPVQLHHGTADAEVPSAFSDRFYADVIAAGEAAEYYLYPGDDHNISARSEDAMRRSLEFLDTHVKGATDTVVDSSLGGSPDSNPRMNSPLME